MARRTLISTAALWLKSEKTYKTYDELKAALLKEFPDAINSKEVHEMMAARRKRRDESCYEYMLTMKEMGKRGKLPDYIAIQYIIDGIMDLEINKTMLYGVSTYADLKEKLKIYENVKKNSVKKVESQYSVKQKSHYKQPERKTRCYNCGEINHISNMCPHKHKGIKCFKCNNFGHVGTQCTSTSSTTSTRKPDDRNKMAEYNNMSSAKQSLCVEYETGQDGVPRSADMSCQQEMSTLCLHRSVCVSKPIKDIEINKIVINALIDSGSDCNLIRETCASRLNVEKYSECQVILIGFGSNQVKSVRSFCESVCIDGHCYKDIKFFVVPTFAMPYDVIIGQELLQQCKVMLQQNSVQIIPAEMEWVCNVSCTVSNDDVFVVGNTVNKIVRQNILKLVKNYNPVRVKEAPIELKIILKDDIPVAQRPRRLAIKEMFEVNKQIQQWLDDGIVRVSYSEYASPLVLVRKKDGSLRVCIDYRLINKKMVKDEYPLPLIEDHIDKLSEAKVFSALDLKNGYFHLKVEDASIKYTSFVTPTGQYEFLRAPFGLAVCPKVFTRFITIIFRDLISQGCVIIFVDDILIPAKDEEQAVSRLTEVLEVASQFGLEINWKKSQLLVRQVEYLGHIIQDGTVKPSPTKTEVVSKFPVPMKVKQLHSFIGLSSYFRKFIPEYAAIARPLTNLLKKDAQFNFTDECKNAFNILKEKLISQPVLSIFNSNLHTELHTDASSVALSAILMQKNREDGELHPVHYMSRKTSAAESRYTSYELEALAIIEGVRKFRHYLFGLQFTIVTDCKSFQMTLSKKQIAMSTRIARWILYLEEFTFTVVHRGGSRMRHTDALSRIPYYVAAITLHDTIKHAQRCDEKLKAIGELLKEKQYEDYYLESDVIYKGLEKRLVIPSGMECEIIERAHSNGHFAKKKTIELINKDYYIEKLEQKVENYIAACIPCLLASRKSGKQEGLLHPIEKYDSPLHTMHLDHIGPMTDTKKQYNHILTMMDAFTKFVWLFPTKGTTSKETIEKLKVHQQTFGNPVRLITDRGTAFTSNEFTEYCENEGIQHVKITTGVPRGNGQVERVHRTIISVLTKLCIETPALWYRHVSRMQRALNSTYHRGIQTTPYQLLIGTKMRMKEDSDIYQLLLEEDKESFIQEREQLRIKAKEGIVKIQEENKKSFNKRRQVSRIYKEGDIVAIKRTQYGGGLKIKPKYFGPYRVIKSKGMDRYDVEKLDLISEGPKLTSTSADFMKVWPS